VPDSVKSEATLKKQITIKDIAEQLGMAHTTVSRALNDHPRISDATKALVRSTADRLGYVVNVGARTMRSGASQLVGLVVPDLRNEFYNAAATALATQCSEAGYQLMLSISDDDPGREEQQVKALRESRCMGVLITPSTNPTAQTSQWLKEMPTVQFLRWNPDLGHVRVIADDKDGVFRATRHLLDLGHRRIAYIGGVLDVSTGFQRHAGFEAALRQRAIGRDAALQRLGAPRPSFGDSAISDLVEQHPDVTAVVVAGVRQLLGVLHGADRRGLSVPNDLSVVCYGDAEWFQVSRPAITSLVLPVEPMAARATDMLFKLLASRQSTRTLTTEAVFTGELKIRGSTVKAATAVKRTGF
jgi:DNA-binding LacI/PurR family transcriptional regulator